MAAPLFSQSSTASTIIANHVTNHVDEFSLREDGDGGLKREPELVIAVNSGPTATSSIAYLPQTVVLCDFRHEGFEESVPLGPAESGLVSKWRPKDRVSSSFEFFFDQRLSCCYRLQMLLFLLIMSCTSYVYKLWFLLSCGSGL